MPEPAHASVRKVHIEQSEHKNHNNGQQNEEDPLFPFLVVDLLFQVRDVLKDILNPGLIDLSEHCQCCLHIRLLLRGFICFRAKEF